jgi:hypothetical protein
MVIPRFQRHVERISSEDNLATVLKLIRHHVATKLSLVDLEEIHVTEVIENEEKRTNCLFVAQDTPWMMWLASFRRANCSKLCLSPPPERTRRLYSESPRAGTSSALRNPVHDTQQPRSKRHSLDAKPALLPSYRAMNQTVAVGAKKG